MVRAQSLPIQQPPSDLDFNEYFRLSDLLNEYEYIRRLNHLSNLKAQSAMDKRWNYDFIKS